MSFDLVSRTEDLIWGFDGGMGNVGESCTDRGVLIVGVSFFGASAVVSAGLWAFQTPVDWRLHGIYTLIQCLSLVTFACEVTGQLPSPPGNSACGAAAHSLLPLAVVPLVVSMVNFASGLYRPDADWILGTLLLADLYGFTLTWYPRDGPMIVGLIIAALTALFSLPVVWAAVRLWPDAVEVAPKVVRRAVNLACSGIFTIWLSSVWLFRSLETNEISTRTFACAALASEIILNTLLPLLLMRPQVAQAILNREVFLRTLKCSSSEV